MLVDPANGRDGVFDVLIDGDRIAQVGRDLPVEPGVARRRDSERPDRVSRPHRHARPPARAGTGAQGNGRDRNGRCRRRRLHGRRVHAEHESGERQRRRDGIHAEESRGREPGARLSDWRGLARAERRAARRHRGVEGGRLRRGHRRRQAGGDGAAHAARARVHEHVQHAGDRALRGPDAQGRRRRPRGLPGLVPRPSRHPLGGRVDHGAARHLARVADRRRRPHRAHERPADARRGPLRQDARRAGDLRGDAASFRPDRRDARRAGGVRHQHEDESAAARGRRPRRHAAGACRRQRRRHRHRPRAARGRREAGRVRSGAVRHHGSRDRRLALLRSPHPSRHRDAAAADRAAVGESRRRS